MICDFDDHEPGNDAMPWMWRLKDANPEFKATLFAIPGLATAAWWDGHPDWVELAVHGWLHPTPHECSGWTRDQMLECLSSAPASFVNGFKAPGWQISDACYDVLLEQGWWVADQHLEDGRRPASLPTYFYEDGGDRWHGHVQDVCGNGLAERWDELLARVIQATEFSFCSDALSLSHHRDDLGARAATR